MPPTPPRVVRYEYLGPIAAGAFSTILRAKVTESAMAAPAGDHASETFVAIKTFDNAKCAKEKIIAKARDRELQVLRMLLETGKCDFEGKHYRIKGLKLRPQPDRDLSGNLWCAGGTNDTVDLIARHNVRPLVIPTTTLELVLETARRYAQMHQAAGYAPSKNKLASAAAPR